MVGWMYYTHCCQQNTGHIMAVFPMCCLPHLFPPPFLLFSASPELLLLSLPPQFLLLNFACSDTGLNFHLQVGVNLFLEDNTLHQQTYVFKKHMSSKNIRLQQTYVFSEQTKLNSYALVGWLVV